MVNSCSMVLNYCRFNKIVLLDKMKSCLLLFVFYAGFKNVDIVETARFRVPC